MEVIKQHEMIKQLTKRIEYPQEMVESICDEYMKLLFEYIQEGISIKYKEFPIMKTKYSIAHVNRDSPRTPRNDRIQITIKLAQKKISENYSCRE